MNFQYIKSQYKVPADMHREVIVNGQKGVITKDMKISRNTWMI